MTSWSTAFCAYAPQVSRSDDEKDDFLEDLLFNVVGNISASEMILNPRLRFNVLSIDYVRVINCFYDYDYYDCSCGDSDVHSSHEYVRTSNDSVIDLVLFNLCYC